MQDKALQWTDASRTHSTNSCEQSAEPAQSLGQSFLWAREIRFIQRKGKDWRRRVMYTTTYNCITIRWLHLNSILRTLQRKRPCRAFAKCIHSVHYTLIFTRCGMKSFSVCYFDQLGSIMAQKSVESIRNQLETTGHNAHVPRRVNLSVNTMQCLAILLFPNANGQSFVAVTHDWGRNARVESTCSHMTSMSYSITAESF